MKKMIFTLIVFLLGVTFAYGADLILSKNVTYDNTESKLNSTNVQDAIDELYGKCEIEENIKYVTDTAFYYYTGEEQTFIVPKSGTYKLETWGASGGGNTGLGGYSVGSIELKENTTLYINVGGAGGKNAGGYNGGGTGQYKAGGVSNAGYGGGGATHIAITSGLLSSLSDNIDDILIVSGGGGGSSESSNAGGSGGGIIGNNGIGSCYVPTGGTQTSFGNAGDNDCVSAGFGYGGSAPNGSTVTGTYGAGGGGGGFYGGGAGSYKSGSNCAPGGGGGSGYIGNSNLTDKSMYCYNCTESEEEDTKTISTTCSNADSIEKCAKIGDGHARISLIT